jgi:hypothetical protein
MYFAMGFTEEKHLRVSIEFLFFKQYLGALQKKKPKNIIWSSQT